MESEWYGDTKGDMVRPVLRLYRAEGGAFARSSFGCRGGDSGGVACMHERRGEATGRGVAAWIHGVDDVGESWSGVALPKATCACTRARGHGAGEATCAGSASWKKKPGSGAGLSVKEMKR